MNESPDALDRLLGDWAASREASEQHTRHLTDQILATARDQLDVGRNKSAQLRQKPTVEAFPELRQVLVRPTRFADWGGQLMIGGGGLLLLLILVGGLVYYNLATTPPGILPKARPIAGSPGTTTPPTIDLSESPAAASLGAAVLAAKRQLLNETSALFDEQLAWIVDGQRQMSLEVGDQASIGDGEFMLVRVVVARRTSADSPWSTVWQADVISRSQSLVEVAPKQFDGSSFALWTYQMPDGAVAVDMDLMLDQNTQLQASSSTVLQAGQPARVSCSSEDGVEQCVFQTVMPLHPSPI